MEDKGSLSGPRGLTIAGLVVGAGGIAMLWGAGVEFPFYPPPGIIILLTGALFVWLARLRWAPAVGAALGLFVVVGFLISPGGIGNLTGAVGTGAVIGSVFQLLGVLTALVAGLAALRQAYRPRTTTSP